MTEQMNRPSEHLPQVHSASTEAERHAIGPSLSAYHPLDHPLGATEQAELVERVRWNFPEIYDRSTGKEVVG
jgi:hypothetical protein